MEQQESTKPIMTTPLADDPLPTPPSPLLTPSNHKEDPPNHHHQYKFTTFAGHRFTNPAYISLALHIPPHPPTHSLPRFQPGKTPHPNHLIPIGDRLIETCYRAALRSGGIPLLPAEPETENLASQLGNRELGQRAKRLGIVEKVCWLEAGAEAETCGVPGDGEVSGMQAAGVLKGLWVGVWMDCLGRDDEGAMEAVREVMGRCGIVLPSGEEFLTDWREGMGREVEVARELRLAMDEAFR